MTDDECYCVAIIGGVIAFSCLCVWIHNRSGDWNKREKWLKKPRFRRFW